MKKPVVIDLNLINIINAIGKGKVVKKKFYIKEFDFSKLEPHIGDAFTKNDAVSILVKANALQYKKQQSFDDNMYTCINDLIEAAYICGLEDSDKSDNSLKEDLIKEFMNKVKETYL